MKRLIKQMENKKKLAKSRIILGIYVLLAIGCLCAGIALWEVYNYWWIQLIGWVLFVGLNILIFIFYHKNFSFKCPKCGKVFKPSGWEMFWAIHTPTKRRLTCPNCSKTSWCAEVYEEKE